jgi:hypothetical protein
VLQAQLALQAQLPQLPDPLAQQERRALKAILELQVLLAHKVHKEMLAQRDLKAFKVRKEFRAMLAQQELLVLLALLALLEPMERLLQ